MLGSAGGAATVLPNNHRSKSAAALGVAALALLDTAPAPGAPPADFRAPAAWLAFAIDQVDLVQRWTFVAPDGGYGEGPYYQRYAAQNLIPFARAWSHANHAQPWDVGGRVIPDLWTSRGLPADATLGARHHPAERRARADRRRQRRLLVLLRRRIDDPGRRRRVRVALGQRADALRHRRQHRPLGRLPDRVRRLRGARAAGRLADPVLPRGRDRGVPQRLGPGRDRGRRPRRARRGDGARPRPRGQRQDRVGRARAARHRELHPRRVRTSSCCSTRAT